MSKKFSDLAEKAIRWSVDFIVGNTQRSGRMPDDMSLDHYRAHVTQIVNQSLKRDPEHLQEIIGLYEAHHEGKLMDRGAERDSALPTLH